MLRKEDPNNGNGAGFYKRRAQIECTRAVMVIHEAPDPSEHPKVHQVWLEFVAQVDSIVLQFMERSQSNKHIGFKLFNKSEAIWRNKNSS